MPQPVGAEQLAVARETPLQHVPHRIRGNVSRAQTRASGGEEELVPLRDPASELGGDGVALVGDRRPLDDLEAKRPQSFLGHLARPVTARTRRDPVAHGQDRRPPRLPSFPVWLHGCCLGLISLDFRVKNTL
jgi:hypothetical protein